MIDSASDTLMLEIAQTDGGQRLDRLLAAKIESLSRARLQGLIRSGAVRIGGRTILEPGHRVKPGDVVTVDVPPPAPAEPAAQDIPLTVAYEDDAVIVIDKPAGQVVHPAPGHEDGTLVNALIAHCGDSLSGIGGVRRPGIVHRIDKDTTGLLVVAKTDEAHKGLAAQFEAHGRDGRLHRKYLAIVWGAPVRPSGVIDAPLARSTHNRTKIAVAKAGGREAVTHYGVREVFRDAEGKPVASLMELVLETGRTHQIRVHCAHMGHPVLGDGVYGAGFKTAASRIAPAARIALSALPGQALHAAELGFEHPITGKGIALTSALPPVMAALVDALRTPLPTVLRKKDGTRRRKSRTKIV